MIDRLGDSLARLVYRYDQGCNASIDELSYGIAHALNTLIPAVLTLSIASILDNVMETMIGMAAFAMFRSLTGGYHFKNPITCIFATTAILTCIPILKYDQCHYVFNTFAILITVTFAPRKIKEQNNLNSKYKPLLTMIAILTVHLNYVIGSDLLSVAFLIQSVTIITVKEGGIFMRKAFIGFAAKAVKSIARAASNTKVRSWVWTHERPVPESLKR
ncbi:MAG: hypothetical protein K0S39_6068 [Paenibacillus sp.]|jgi:accessory gene regulator B|nr:hypothetical protein [Paenibacillus sp.]